MFPDPVVLMVAWLGPLVPEGTRVSGGLPNGFTGKDTPLVHVRDAGGPGPIDRVLDQVRITFDVYHPERGQASRIARTIQQMLHESQADGWHWVSDTSRPAYLPDVESGAHMFRYTVRINTKPAQ